MAEITLWILGEEAFAVVGERLPLITVLHLGKAVGVKDLDPAALTALVNFTLSTLGETDEEVTLH